ncbi:hypothetical protein BBP40_006482, partial [Aspergillus hancockii]
MSRPHNAHPGALPAISSNLRMGTGPAAPGGAIPGGGTPGGGGGGNTGGPAVTATGQRRNAAPQHAPGLSVVVDSRVPAESIESSDSDQSEGVNGGGRDGAGPNGLGDADYASSPGNMARG